MYMTEAQRIWMVSHQSTISTVQSFTTLQPGSCPPCHIIPSGDWVSYFLESGPTSILSVSRFRVMSNWILTLVQSLEENQWKSQWQKLRWRWEEKTGEWQDSCLSICPTGLNCATEEFTEIISPALALPGVRWVSTPLIPIILRVVLVLTVAFHPGCNRSMYIQQHITNYYKIEPDKKKKKKN